MDRLQSFNQIQGDPRNHAEHINTKKNRKANETQKMDGTAKVTKTEKRTEKRYSKCVTIWLHILRSGMLFDFFCILLYFSSMKFFAAFLILISSLAFAQKSADEQFLSNEGFYLLSPEQKEKFRSLPEMEKQAYLNNLWTSMDPDSMTPENEFQVEYMKRFEHVKKIYGIPSDRAKIYLLLGAPNSVESHSNSDKYYPLEVWSYYSLGHKGLPPSLDLIFFKRWGAGDYRLYSPIFDGLKALTPTGLDFENPRIKSQLKAYFDASVIEAAQHITTGAGPNESEIIRATLQDPGAMTRILQKQRPNVETTIIYQGFDADIYTYTVPAEAEIFRTSVAVAISPKYLTFEKDNTEYRARIDLIGKITDEQGHEVLRINDTPAIKMTASDFEKAKSFFFSYLFDSYLLPGKYNLDCLFRDYASNAAGKLEKTFEIKSFSSDLELLPPLLAYKSTSTQGATIPFGYDYQQFLPKENSVFNNEQVLNLYTVLLNPKKTRLEGIWKLRMAIKKDGTDVMATEEDLPLSTSVNTTISRRLKLQGLVSGDYSLEVQLTHGGTTLASEAPIKISTEYQVLGRMRVLASSNRTPEEYHTNLALQYFFRGNFDEASKHVRIALDFSPVLYSARSLSARIEKAKGHDDAAIATYEKLVEESPADSEGFFLIGKWSMEKQEWEKGSAMMKKAISLGYYTTEALNSLAGAEIELGNKDQAIDYWEKSLALDSNQPEIQKQISTYKR